MPSVTGMCNSVVSGLARAAAVQGLLDKQAPETHYRNLLIQPRDRPQQGMPS